jgi:hypothetical protein
VRYNGASVEQQEPGRWVDSLPECDDKINEAFGAKASKHTSHRLVGQVMRLEDEVDYAIPLADFQGTAAVDTSCDGSLQIRASTVLLQGNLRMLMHHPAATYPSITYFLT